MASKHGDSACLTYEINL